MSVYEGWLSIGGNEIVNNTRTRGIAESAQPCPMYWLRGDVCATMQDALGDLDGYDWPSITSAPWYDSAIPQSTDFFGFFAYAITEVMDSTRTVNRVESVGDGGVLGRARKAIKTLRVRGVLMGASRMGVEYGQAWLTSAVDENTCGQHGTECGLTDVAWFADCPPPRGTVPVYSGWTVQATNLATNPSAEANATNWAGVSSATTSRVTTEAHLGTASVQVVTPGAVAGEGVSYAENVSGMLANTYAAGIWVKAPVGTALYAVTRSQGGSALDSSQVQFTGTGDWQYVPTNPITGQAGATSLQVLVRTKTAQAVTFYVDNAILVKGSAAQAYFDGDTVGDNFDLYAWTGAAGASTSTWSTRTATSRPQTDDEYATLVNPYIRYLHGAKAVSGPILGATYNVGEFWAFEVEMIFGAERPWVYGVTTDIGLPPTTPVIVQDIPYNLAPYPSAELSSGTVVTATNYAPNPSLETDATGWSSSTDGTLITAAQVTAGRITGELAAVGTASYRCVFTATGASAALGWFAAQAPAVNISALPAGSRLSFNVWGAALAVTGTPSLGTVNMNAYWYASTDGTGATLTTTPLGSAPANGGAISLKSVARPAGANSVRVIAIFSVNSWAAGNVVRGYCDAVAVTVP